MYELTASEGATLLSILARDGEVQNSNLRRPEVPASTFYATRRKIYQARWVTDRYVPNPWATGFSAIDCVLSLPPASERSRIEKEWGASQTNVLLWSGMNVLFGVFFRRMAGPTPAEEGTRVTATQTSGSVPIYFDYSRPWSRFVRLDRETGYPRSVGVEATHTERSRTSALPELFHLDRDAETASSPGPRWHSPLALPRNQRLLLEWGLARSRTFLNVEALPPYEGRLLGEIVFITGKLRAGILATHVLTELSQQCRVNPILLTDDGTTLLMVALGQIVADEPRRRRVHSAVRPVVTTLGSLLEDVRVIIERADSMQKLVDHRYDRLFQPAP